MKNIKFGESFWNAKLFQVCQVFRLDSESRKMVFFLAVDLIVSLSRPKSSFGLIVRRKQKNTLAAFELGMCRRRRAEQPKSCHLSPVFLWDQSGTMRFWSGAISILTLHRIKSRRSADNACRARPNHPNDFPTLRRIADDVTRFDIFRCAFQFYLISPLFHSSVSSTPTLSDLLLYFLFLQYFLCLVKKNQISFFSFAK